MTVIAVAAQARDPFLDLFRIQHGTRAIGRNGRRERLAQLQQWSCVVDRSPDARASTSESASASIPVSTGLNPTARTPRSAAP